MDRVKNKLRLGYPEEGNEKFQVVTMFSPIYIALEDFRGCYIGFDHQGELITNVCLRNKQNSQARFVLKTFIKSSH